MSYSKHRPMFGSLGLISFPTAHPRPGAPALQSQDSGPGITGVRLPGPITGGGGGGGGGSVITGGRGVRSPGGRTFPGGLHPGQPVITKTPGSIVTLCPDGTVATSVGCVGAGAGGSTGTGSGGGSGTGAGGSGGGAVDPNIAAGDACIMAGGTWDGTSCTMPTVTPIPDLVAPSTWVPGVPNYVTIGAAALAAFLLLRKKR